MARARPKPIIEGGKIAYRTKLMEESGARRFARCVAANSSRFNGVLVNRSAKAKGSKAYFVSFAPVSIVRQDALAQSAQKAREDRAQYAMDHEQFVFWNDADTSFYLYWCFSALSRETYEVTISGDCTCPDFAIRCRSLGIRCKHGLALLIYLKSRKGEIMKQAIEEEERDWDAERKEIAISNAIYEHEDWLRERRRDENFNSLCASLPPLTEAELIELHQEDEAMRQAFWEADAERSQYDIDTDRNMPHDHD